MILTKHQKQKRKSESNHKSPTSPETSSSKTIATRTTVNKPKSQTRLTTIAESKEQTKLTFSHHNNTTKSTQVSREMKQEKITQTATTPSQQKLIELSSPDEDELYSSKSYKETPDTSPKPSALIPEDGDKNATPIGKTSKEITPHSKPPSPRHSPTGRGGRGGRRLVDQGRGARGVGPILPPTHLKGTAQPSAQLKIPINLTSEFDKETDHKSQKDAIDLTDNDPFSSQKQEMSETTPTGPSLTRKLVDNQNNLALNQANTKLVKIPTQKYKPILLDHP